LLKDRFPYLVDVYDGFENTVRRSDLLRYAVIYEFGGVYSDVDVKNVRPLDIATIRYACILPTETFEHSTLLNDMQMIINTAVLLCRPKHPFFKLLLHNLQVVNGNLHPVHLTGPGFITRVYMKYNNLQIDDLNRPKTDNDTNSPYFYKGTRDVEDGDGLYIPNTQYFMDTIDPWIIDKNDNIEDCVDFKLVHDLLKRGCAEYEHRRELRKRKKYAFTIHYWTHIWAMPESMKRSRLNYINVKYIVPSCILY
jgi:mannosyltransferase OCH1-like enzyme